MGRHDLIVLTFTEPLRGRELRAGYLPSDGLWGALYAADVNLQGRPMDLDGIYRVSSAFPFIDGTWLLPKPRVSAAADGPGSDPGDKKAVKRLEFVNLDDFGVLAAGGRLDAAALEEAAARQRRALLPTTARPLPLVVQDGTLSRLVTASRQPRTVNDLARERHGMGAARLNDSERALLERELTQFPQFRTVDDLAHDRYGVRAAALSDAERLHLSREVRGRRSTGLLERQRNTQDRVTQQTDTFTTEGLTQSRVAFILETTSEAQRGRLFGALRLLADTGYGGLRTQGSGQFHWEAQPVPAALARRLQAGGPQVLLGLTRPSPEEAGVIDSDAHARYTLVRRGGYLDGTALQRQDVWMLAEGSLVPGPLNGTVTDVGPTGHPHPVWRCGLAVSIGVTA